MQSHGVAAGPLVGSLHDVDLAVHGPVVRGRAESEVLAWEGEKGLAVKKPGARRGVSWMRRREGRGRGVIYSESQRAGHVPHPYGVCFTSKMKSPLLYCLLDSTRTEKRPVEAFGTDSGPTLVSTRRTALELDAKVKFWGSRLANLAPTVWFGFPEVLITNCVAVS